MTILHITGKPRKGKGILTTFLSLGIADGGKPVDSNYHLWDKEHREMSNVQFLDFYQMLTFLKKPRVEPEHLLNIDELPGWCDSYVTQAKSSRFASHFLNQSAKLGYDLIFTSQRSKRADINFREMADVRMEADRKSLCGNKRCPFDCEHLGECHFTYQPMDMNELEQDTPKGKPLKLDFLTASTFWSRFDTYEAVPPVGLDEALIELQKYDPKRRNETINYQVRAVQEAWQPSWYMDRTTVKDVLIELEISDVYSDVVFSRLRRQRLEKPQLQLGRGNYRVAEASTPKDALLAWQRWRKPTTAH